MTRATLLWTVILCQVWAKHLTGMISIMPPTIPPGRHYHYQPHFTEGKTEAQVGSISCPRSQSSQSQRQGGTYMSMPLVCSGVVCWGMATQPRPHLGTVTKPQHRASLRRNPPVSLTRAVPAFLWLLLEHLLPWQLPLAP